MYKNSLLFFLVFLDLQAFGQIQVNASDAEIYFSSENTWYVYEAGNVNINWDVGTASSSSQDWVAPNFTPNYSYISYNVPLVSTPYTMLYPNATNAQKSGDSSYSYYRFTTDSLVWLGDVEGSSNYIANQVLMIFPMTLGSVVRESRDSMYFGGGSYMLTITSTKVDAFGKITLSIGNFDALRMNTTTTTATYFNGVLLSSYSNYNYAWFTKTAGIFQVNIKDGSPASGLTTVSNINLTLIVKAPTDIKENSDLITEYKLNQNYPNPFNPSTKISWQSPVTSQQTLKVFDVLGNEIATLVDEYKPAGSYEVEFNTSTIKHQPSSGVYFYQLKTGEYIQTKKMILLR